MGRLMSAVLVAMSCSHASAQGNLVELTSGRTVDWTCIRDKGESIEIQSVSGPVTVKKAEVRGITVKSPKPVLAVDPKAPVNLLAGLDADRDFLSGSWKLTQKGLSVESANPQSKAMFSVDVPEEYEISAVLERKGDSDWGGDFCFGLVGGGRQFTAVIDANDGNKSGFELIDGKGIDLSGAGKLGTVFQKRSGAKLVILTVTRKVLSMSIDGKVIASIQPDYSRMSVSQHRVVRDGSRLFLTTSKWGAGVSPSTWTISRMILTPKPIELAPPK